MSRDKLDDLHDPYACQCKRGLQGKSGTGKIHEVIRVRNKLCEFQVSKQRDAKYCEYVSFFACIESDVSKSIKKKK